MRKVIGAVVGMLWASTAQAEWYEASSKHFVVYSDSDPVSLKAYTTRLERYDAAVKALWNVPDDNRGPSSRVTVFQVDTVEAVQKLANAPGGNIAGFYSSRATGSVSFVPRESRGNGEAWQLKSERVLLHEYAHHFMYADWPSAIFPRWFSEGFAEYLSTAIFNADGSVTFGAPPTDRAWGVAMINQMPLSKMLQPALGKLNDQETYALYSRGWLLTHFLVNDPERRKQLAGYIGAINEGKSVDDATKIFGNLNALDFKLMSYAKRPSFASLVVPASALKIGPVDIRKLTAGETATMPTRLRTTAGVSAQTAPLVAAQARRAAAPFPNDAGAQNELAEAEYDAKDYPAAIAAAERAMAADPKSVHAVLYKGMALQAVAEAAQSNDDKRWQDVRRWYIAGNKLAVEDPQPLILYYRSFKPAGGAPSKSADAGLLYASALAPFDLDLRIDAARVYMQQADTAKARKALMPVAYSPHGGENAAKVRTIMTTLDTGGVQPALAQLDALLAEVAAKAKKDGKTSGED